MRLFSTLLFSSFFSVFASLEQCRNKSTPKFNVPRLRYPKWYLPQFRVVSIVLLLNKYFQKPM